MRVWRETAALMGVTCWYAAGMFGLVCLTEWATSFLPTVVWTIGDVTA